MDSLKVLKYHVNIFKVFGLWPTQTTSIWYTFYSYAVIILILIGFPGTLLVSVIFVNSLNQIVDNLVITSSLAMAGLKGINVLIQRKNIRKLFVIIQRLDAECDSSKINFFDDIFKESKILLKLFMYAYLLAYTCLGSQSVWSKKGQGLWSSTYFLPFQFADNQLLYNIVFVHQAISNCIICIIDAAVDTYGVILCHILGGHIDVLGSRLKSLGYYPKCTNTNRIVNDIEVKMDKRNGQIICIDELRKCVKTYETCLV